MKCTIRTNMTLGEMRSYTILKGESNYTSGICHPVTSHNCILPCCVTSQPVTVSLIDEDNDEERHMAVCLSDSIVTQIRCCAIDSAICSC
jgi:hypothetical protein